MHNLEHSTKHNVSVSAGAPPDPIITCMDGRKSPLADDTNAILPYEFPDGFVGTTAQHSQLGKDCVEFRAAQIYGRALGNYSLAILFADTLGGGDPGGMGDADLSCN